MLTNLKIQLAQKAAGRILLHLGCLLRGGRWDFHWTGVRRELACLFKYKNFVTGLGSRHQGRIMCSGLGWVAALRG